MNEQHSVRLLIPVSATHCADSHIWAFVTVSLLPSQKAPWLWKVSDSSQYPTSTGKVFLLVSPKDLCLSPTHVPLFFPRLHLKDCMVGHYASCICTPFVCLGVC